MVASIAINWDVTGVIYIATRTPINQGGLYIIHEAKCRERSAQPQGVIAITKVGLVPVRCVRRRRESDGQVCLIRSI